MDQPFACRTVLVKDEDEDDRALVRRCLQGDRSAFEPLVLRYQKPVFNAALRLLHNLEDARDVAQTTFLKAYQHLGDYDDHFKFYSWIYRIAVNEALDSLNSRKPSEAVNDAQPDEAEGPERIAEGAEVGRAIERELAGISPELRAVIVLRHLMNLSYQEMSEILVLPEKTVKSRLYSARQLLRERLQHYGI